VICLAWWSKAKKRVRRTFYNRPSPYSNRRIKKKAHDAYEHGRQNWRRTSSYMKRANRRHQIVGWTPDYWVSPIDAIPYVGPAYSKGKKGYKGAKWTKRKSKQAVETFKAGYRTNSRRRGRKSSSPSGRRRRRGNYYYYRGKRIYRK
tara:strand:+ start:25 stop:465 length:441 start_codon:yes stop_codon:yes gene_type:complete